MNIFISYNSRNVREAQQVKSALVKNGISTWIAPECIPYGSDYTREIPLAIAKCNAMVLILSSAAQDSRWVLAEVENAFKNAKRIIPYFIEPCTLKPEFDFLLSRSQHVEAYEDTQRALDFLVTYLRSATAAKDVHRIECSDGAIYEGEMLNGSFHGKGKLTWADGGAYDGDWFNDAMSGIGRFTWANGDIYEGEWLNNVRTGKGRFIWASGSVYDGDWVDNKRTGKGKYTWTNGCTYEGDLVDGEFHGKGKYTYRNGNYYEGDFVSNRYSGKGKMVYPESGEVYEGDFANDAINGYGVYTWPDGRRYEGEFSGFLRTGNGTFTDKDGAVTVGTFKNGECVDGKEYAPDGELRAMFIAGIRINTK